MWLMLILLRQELKQFMCLHDKHFVAEEQQRIELASHAAALAAPAASNYYGYESSQGHTQSHTHTHSLTLLVL